MQEEFVKVVSFRPLTRNSFINYVIDYHLSGEFSFLFSSPYEEFIYKRF